MNSLTETLNHWGARIPDFAWPMLWQSSVLILVLFAFDFALRRKVRASVRYALWLVVLVKLLLPPSLALPTSLAWWLRPSAVQPAREAQTPAFVVAYGDFVPANLPTPAPPVFVPPPKPSLSAAGRAAATWVVASACLLAWLAMRWRKVAGEVRGAMVRFDSLKPALEEAQHDLKLPGRIQLLVTQRAMSPAVCGLFRPVILLPQSLVERLTPSQLRAVLLHELVHLRRGDVWVNCVQALLQILYWWHPLLWVANARIRRVREEAVDDAVMLALADDRDNYAPTLLEVARLAFNRPQASLGLVGILESRSALRQRIERLVDFHPPRKAGLTGASALCVLAFAVVAVPMEQAPATPETANSKLEKDARADADTESPPATRSALATNLVFTGKGRKAIMSKLDQIRFDRVHFESVPLSEVVRLLTDESQRRDPEGEGIRFLVDPNTVAAAQIDPTTGLPLVGAVPPERVDISEVSININPPLSNVRLADVLEAVVRVADKPIKYSLEEHAVVFSLKGPQLEPLLTRVFKVDTNTFYEGLERVTGQKLEIQNSVGSVPRVRSEATNQGGGLRFITRTNAMEQVSVAVRMFFSTLGVDLGSPTALAQGKSVFWNDRSGRLLVRATSQDLDMIEAAIELLNRVPQQINIKARFVEIERTDPKTTGWDWFSKIASSNSLAILTDPQYRVVLRALEQGKGADVLTAPEVTTVSGRQAQIQAVEMKTVVTGINPLAGVVSTNGTTNSLYQTQTVPMGPVLDVIPYLSSDGYTIQLTVIPSVTEFLGYDDPGIHGLTNAASPFGQTVLPLPRFRVRQTTATAVVWDGQTLALLIPVTTEIIKKPDGTTETKDVSREQKKQLIVFVTPTMVDASGNRLHSHEEILLARPSIPQPPAKTNSTQSPPR